MHDPSSLRPRRVLFHGNAREYFGIWIVNLLLSIVTLGIYSAWAKVRTNKYFYQNTEIADRRFDYHATGMQILIGRIIIVAAFIIFQLLALVPLALLLVIIGFLFLFPWLVTRSLRFNARVTTWANVRFNFDGKPGRAFLVYLLYPVLSALTLYLAYPFADRARRRFVVGHHLIGRSRLSFDSGIGPFYMAMLAFVGVVLVTLVLTFAGTIPTLMQLFSDGSFRANRGFDGMESFVWILVRAYIGAAVAFVLGGMVYAAMMRNIIYCGTKIEGGHALHSDMPVGGYVWVGLSNAVVVIITLGLMLPWAKVRMARFLAAHTQVMIAGDLDAFIGDILPEGGAFGDAYTDMEAIDLGLPA